MNDPLAEIVGFGDAAAVEEDPDGLGEPHVPVFLAHLLPVRA